MDNPSAGRNHGIPADNPFAASSDPNVRTEIFAKGFRNPWKINTDPLNVDIWVATVGGWYQDYASIVKNRDNLGWPILEGNTCFANDRDAGDRTTSLPTCDRKGLKEPTIPLPHGKPENCVIGGPVYRANPRSALYGAIFLGDYNSCQFWAATVKEGILTELKEYPNAPIKMTHMTIDSKGNVYAADYESGIILILDHPELALGAVPIRPQVKRALGSRSIRMFVDLGNGGQGIPGNALLFTSDGRKSERREGNSLHKPGVFFLHPPQARPRKGSRRPCRNSHFRL